MQVRNLSIDLGKGIFIALVVLGHFLEVSNSWKVGPFELLLTFIYLVHIPAFAFLSGVTAKVGKAATRAVKNLALVLIFQGLYFVVCLLTNSDRKFSYFPFWLLWFLVAVTIWQLSVGLIKRFPKVFVLGSLVLASLSGTLTWIGNDFALSRTFIFFPFFVVGAIYGNRILIFAGQTWNSGTRILFAAFPLAVGLLIYKAHLSPWWFFANRSYEALGGGISNGKGIVIRLVLLFVSAIFVLSSLVFLKYLPKFVALLGERSLAIYLYHGFAVIALDKWLKFGQAAFGTYFSIAGDILVTALVVWLLSLSWFSNSLVTLGALPETIWVRYFKSLFASKR